MLTLSTTTTERSLRDVIVTDNGVEVLISGLTEEEEDELYSSCEGEFGSDGLLGAVGDPYRLTGSGIPLDELKSFVRHFVKSKGYRVRS